jgi:hypothetical protein
MIFLAASAVYILSGRLYTLDQEYGEKLLSYVTANILERIILPSEQKVTWEKERRCA